MQLQLLWQGYRNRRIEGQRLAGCDGLVVVSRMKDRLIVNVDDAKVLVATSFDSQRPTRNIEQVIRCDCDSERLAVEIMNLQQFFIQDLATNFQRKMRMMDMQVHIAGLDVKIDGLHERALFAEVTFSRTTSIPKTRYLVVGRLLNLTLQKRRWPSTTRKASCHALGRERLIRWVQRSRHQA
jgi:hypothetical protein